MAANAKVLRASEDFILSAEQMRVLELLCQASRIHLTYIPHDIRTGISTQSRRSSSMDGLTVSC